MQMIWHIGDVVAKLRGYKRWSQKVLAKKADLAASTVVRLEAAGNCESATLDKVAHALGVSVAELYTAIPKAGQIVFAREESLTRTVGYRR